MKELKSLDNYKVKLSLPDGRKVITDSTRTFYIVDRFGIIKSLSTASSVVLRTFFKLCPPYYSYTKFSFSENNNTFYINIFKNGNSLGVIRLNLDMLIKVVKLGLFSDNRFHSSKASFNYKDGYLSTGISKVRPGIVNIEFIGDESVNFLVTRSDFKKVIDFVKDINSGNQQELIIKLIN